MLENKAAFLQSDSTLIALQALALHEDIHVDRALDVTVKIICF